jgi:hypothetical protein
LFSINEYRRPSPKQLRSFGLILAAGFFVIGFGRVILRHASPVRWALALSVVFLVTGVVVPKVLRPVHRVWMALGNILGWINSRIILGVLYYVVVTPISLLMRLAGHDPMNRRFDSKVETYRVKRNGRPVSHMNHQF